MNEAWKKNPEPPYREPGLVSLAFWAGVLILSLLGMGAFLTGLLARL